MGYGFNPDEVVTTRIDLIDKDGFHKVGEASDCGNDGGFNKDSSWIIFEPGKDDYGNLLVTCLVHLSRKDHSSLPEFSSSGMYYPLCSALYKGKSINFSSLTFNDEGGNIKYTEDEKVIGEQMPSINSLAANDSLYHLGYIFYSDRASYENHGIPEKNIPLILLPEIEKGETVHLILNYDSETTIQIDAVWTIGPEDFEE